MAVLVPDSVTHPAKACPVDIKEGPKDTSGIQLRYIPEQGTIVDAPNLRIFHRCSLCPGV